LSEYELRKRGAGERDPIDFYFEGKPVIRHPKRIYLDVALKRLWGVPSNLYQAVFDNVLWVTYDIT